ncbi:transketolase [Mycolicibacterium septicum DSM 44393]|uniref:Transketolase n=2 Tax=Mycolicibacterium septicum TaxID=98668 RepID=A0A7X6RVL9_9MYCO|nr:transketolase [Mycolicibacterium septicum DSM 44393]
MLERAPGLHTLADTIAELADNNNDVVAGTADLKYSNGLVRFQERHPDRYIQFGISEQHMVSAAAGMAAAGLVPYVATFASFLALLCCEQIRTDCAWTKLPVRLIGHHAGITLGFYGTSHHALEDLAIGRSIAGLTVVAPADSAQLEAALRASIDHEGPIYFRIGRGRDPKVYDSAELSDFRFGAAISHGEGSDLTIIATGSMVHPAITAAERLKRDGLSVGVLDVHTLKPFDAEAVLAAASRSDALLTVEEHSVIGGLGGAVAETLAEAGVATRLRRHGVKDEYAPVGPPTHLYAHYGLDADGIEIQARTLLR